MNDFEYDMNLYDRIEVIRKVNQRYDLINNSFISFSGGKDSLIVSKLIDIALPDNNIPRVFINTGIEYNDVVKFVKDMSLVDKRIVMIRPTVNIKDMLNRYGYPFKSKEHSHHVSIYQHSGMSKSVVNYLVGDKMIRCPHKLVYQFSDAFNIKVSDMCCYKLKKEPAKFWQKANGKHIVITGMMKEEGGQRLSINCIVNDKSGNIVKFHPLAVVTKEFEDEFISRNNIEVCCLYLPPYNFKRTGCKGCPYSLDLAEQLSVMELYLPNERKQCEYIWGAIYDEYRRIDYRLCYNEQLKLF